MNKKTIITMVLCSLVSIGLFAQNTTTEAKEKYTFGDFLMH